MSTYSKVFGAILISLVVPALLPAQSNRDTGVETPLRVAERIRIFAEDTALIRRRLSLRGSPARNEAMTRLVDDALRAMTALPSDGLDADSRVDRLLFVDHLRAQKTELAREHALSLRVRDWIPGAVLIESLVENGVRLDDLDAKTTLAALSKATKATEECSGLLGSQGAKRPDAKFARQIARACDGYRVALSRWVKGREGYDPAFSWWFPRPAKDLGEAMGELSKRLRSIAKQGGGELGILGQPIGREALVAALRRERIAYSPEELIEIGRREMAWCRTQREAAAAALGLGKDWKKALDVVKQDHVAPGRQPALIRELAEEAVTFLEERRLIRIPNLAKEGWRIEMMSAARQRYTPYFTGGEVISVAYPMHDMDARQKSMTMRGNNRHFCKATVHHELIPGHHLQGYMASRYQTHRRRFSTPFLVEGWALYWELRLWDLGFANSPKEQLGMLFWRSHRCARIIFSLSFHLGKMSPQEAIDFLVDEVGHERKNATAEVRRSFEGGYSPLYQAAYMLGGLQMRALHHELVGQGNMAEEDFHEAILRQNSIPISLIRARLTGRFPSLTAVPSWRFYELD